MTIKGKVSITAVILHIFLIVVSGMMYRYMSVFFYSGEIKPDDILFYVIIFIFILFTLFAVISPLISIKNIYIDETSLCYRYLLLKKSYDLKEIEGCFTMELPSRDTTYETIYPVSRNKILPPISSFYISNYDQVKKEIPFRSLGKIKFSWKNYMVLLLFKKYNELNR